MTFNTTSEEDRRIQRHPIPVAGISSELGVAMEKYYNKHMLDTTAQKKKKASQEKPGMKPSPVPSHPDRKLWDVEKR